MGPRKADNTGTTQRSIPDLTPWHQIEAARDLMRGINELARTYSRPVYCFLLRWGYAEKEAQRLTRTFFCQFPTLLRHADRSKGRFRDLLLDAIQRFAEVAGKDNDDSNSPPVGGPVRLDVAHLAGVL
jgi:hypothetical protein